MSSRPTSVRSLIGAVIILIGIGFLLDGLALGGYQGLMTNWWPIVIMATAAILWGGNPRAWIVPLVVFLTGLAMFLDRFDVLPESAWTYYWPTLIILFGARVLFGSMKPRPDRRGDEDSIAFFGGVERVIKGSIERLSTAAWFGGVKLDLREADIKDQASLSVTAVFGGVEIFLPKDTQVVSGVIAILGGVDDKSDHSQTSRTLRLEGLALFGGVTIKN